jgi:hypothetical protein
MQLLLDNFEKLVSGGISISHNTNITLEQINASGAYVPNPEIVIANPAVANQVSAWLSDRRAGYRVYIVNTSLSTTSISVSSSSEIAAAFGTKPPTCSTTANVTASGQTSGGSSNTNTTGQGGAPTKTGTTASKSTKAPIDGSTANSTPGNVGNKSGLGLLACISAGNTSQATLSTMTPLIFAASLNPVSVDNAGNLRVDPVLHIATGTLLASEGSLPPESSNWEPKPWPTTSRN